MGSRRAADPFYLVREEIASEVRAAQASFARHAALARDATARAAAERQTLARELETQCASAEWQLEELGKTVDAVERQPSRFGVDAAEAASRRRWVQEQRIAIAQLRDALADSAKVTVESTRTQADAAAGGGAAGYVSQTDRIAAAAAEENDAFMGSETDHQQLLMRQQDTDLEALSVSVQRLGGVGKTIAEELETQATMLDDLDEEADTVLGRLNATQRRLQRLVKKAGMRGQICMVVFLLITLCVLVAFTFYG